MNTEPLGKQVVDKQQQLNDMLAEAMKQPGLEIAIQLMEAAEKSSQPAKEFASYIDWHRFPVLSTTCGSPDLEPA
jgi:hypothetical protein